MHLAFTYSSTNILVLFLLMLMEAISKPVCIYNKIHPMIILLKELLGSYLMVDKCEGKGNNYNGSEQIKGNSVAVLLEREILYYI